MSDDLDDWLNSLGLEAPSPTPQPTTPTITEPEPEVIVPQAEPEELSSNDFNDLIDAIGLSSPQEFDEAEELYDDEEDEEEELPAVISNRPADPDPLEPLAAATSEILQDAAGVPQGILAQIMQDEGVHPEVNAPIIQPNSPTLLIDDSTSRFSGAEWFNEMQKQRIIIAGCGGIGSNLAFQIARMHPAKMFLYDDDTVEMANMAGQLYSRNDVGATKVAAIQRMINDYTTAPNIYSIAERFTASTEPGNIMMSGFDNMVARREFFDSWLHHVMQKSMEEREKCLYLDGRLSIDTLQILCIRGDDTYNISRYDSQFLFTDEEADHTVCSMKQTTYLACMIASLMTNLFTNFVANQLNPIVPYDLPFFTEYDAQNMIFRTER